MTEPTEETVDTTVEEGLPLAPLEDEQPEQEDEGTAASGEDAPDEDANKKSQKAADVMSVQLPEAQAGGAPPWVRLPPGFVFPRGKQVLFLRFKSSWTDTPWKGEPMLDPETGVNEVDANGKEVIYRQCVCWPINTGDKKLALGRAQRDPNRAADELAKQMIRVHDGVECDWAVVRANGVEMLWNELGEKCRGLLQRIFSQLHVLDTGSTRDFLTNCIEVRSTGS